jgi:hypothetical protein
VATRVDLFPHLAVDAEAFRDLSTDREIGMGRGPIPWSAIHLYGERYGLVKDDFDRLVRIIRAMDGAYLSYFAEREK